MTNRILEAGTDEEIFALLRLAPPILREHISGTKYDIPKENWPSVAVRSSFVPELPVFETLYQSMSDQQKKAADKVFQQIQKRQPPRQAR